MRALPGKARRENAKGSGLYISCIIERNGMRQEFYEMARRRVVNAT